MYIYCARISSNDAFCRKSAADSLATHSQIQNNASNDNTKEESLLHNAKTFRQTDNCFCFWGSGNWDRCWSRRRVPPSRFSIINFIIAVSPISDTIKRCCGSRSISKPTTTETTGREVLYSSTWIPSSGTGNSPLFVIVTAGVGLSPDFGTFSIFSTSS